MTRLPPAPLVPNNTLITATAEEGRAFITLARHSIHAMQKELEVLKSGRAQIRARWSSPRSPRPTTIGAEQA